MDTFSVSVLAGVIAAAIWTPIGFWLGASFQRLRLRRPVRWFWQLPPENKEVLISASVHNYDPAEGTAYIPTGDTLTMAEVTSLLKRNFRGLVNVFYSDPQSTVRAWGRTVVLIGGGKGNVTSRCLLAALAPPLHAYDHEDVEHDYKGLKNKRRDRIISPPESSEEDSAFIIRTLDPLNCANYVYIIAGGRTFATYAAARWSTDPKNLRWVKRKYERRRFLNFLLRRSFRVRRWVGGTPRPRPKFNSIQVVLKVQMHNQPEPMAVPSIADATIWHGGTDDEGVALNRASQKPDLYYFHTPCDYLQKYREYSRGDVAP
ncbi:hypothetical protein MQE23_20655 [Streptomyces sp. HP-A2021]|uniref:hypothetical protein n=1 Tax=Streptomyces sp. HP-A2021 TaxID=2927875 RepID=UPI001FAE9091|nr:hypothetical protein [Streptomyces sp. HP-A2021]UOB11331.1 hypothetical protein MQE23_20655 [Streptomyces sp. HP-A2021]